MSPEHELMRDPDTCEAGGSVGGSEDRVGVGPGALHEGGGDRPDPPSARDYFDNPAPLLGDRESREREERIGRLEHGRHRRRAPRIMVGPVLVLVVVLAAGALLVLGRPEHHESTIVKPSGAVRPPVRETPVRSGPAPAIGPARAIAAAPVRHPRKASHRSHHEGQAEPADTGEDVTSAATETPAPEAAATEPAATSTGSEPTQSTSTSTEESSGSKTSSSTEADTQFGFAR